jgi:CheY-like chemotaxis protein
MVPQDRGSDAARILVVDDERLIRDLLCRMLECDEYEVLSASNGPDALEICRRSFRPIQLLVTDVQMPVMSGYELADRCARLYPELCVLFVSGSIPDESMQAALSVPNLAFLSKPVRPEVLQRQARAMLAGPALDIVTGSASPHSADRGARHNGRDQVRTQAEFAIERPICS